MTGNRENMRIGRLLLLGGILFAAAIFFSGCQETADSCSRLGDSLYIRGDKLKALQAYEKAMKLAPDDHKIRQKTEAVRSEILHESLKVLAMAGLIMVFTIALSVLTVRQLSPEASGKSFMYRLRLVSGFLNWQEAEELRADYLATRNFLVKRRIYSYLRPLSDILHEFFLMRDIRVASLGRLDELQRILQKDITRLDEIAAAAEDSSFARETRAAAGEYRTRVMEQKKKIIEFAAAFEQRRRLFHGFLIDLRTRLDLNRKFDGISEMNKLSQKISAVRKTYMTIEKEWSV